MFRAHPVLVLSLVVAFGGVGACAEDAQPSTPAPFTCTPSTCPDGSCQLHVQFDANCAEQFDKAEILLDGALEPDFAPVDGVYQSVGQVPVDQVGEFWIRSETWQWGPIRFTCESPSDDGRFTLSCQPGF